MPALSRNLSNIDGLAKKASAFEDVQTPGFEAKSPLVISICTKGPVHQLWAHYTVMKRTRQEFHMVPIRGCRATTFDEVLPWLSLVDNVVRWGAGEYLEDIVRKLGKVTKMGKTR